MVVEDILQKIRAWAETNQYVTSVLLVGSYARNEQQPDSDIDIVVLCTNPLQLLYDTYWINTFGNVERYDLEKWGVATSIRTRYTDGMEIEFGIVPETWANVPVDSGTKAVIAKGAKIIVDKTGALKILLVA